MNANTRIQVVSAIGIAITIPTVYIALSSGNEGMASGALVVFGLCILATPAMKVAAPMKRKREAMLSPSGAQS